MYKRCASKTFSFHQSLSLRSALQHKLRRGHQLSWTLWAGFGFEPSLFSSQPRLFPSLSVTAQISHQQYCKALGDEGKWSVQAQG